MDPDGCLVVKCRKNLGSLPMKQIVERGEQGGFVQYLRNGGILHEDGTKKDVNRSIFISD